MKRVLPLILICAMILTTPFSVMAEEGSFSDVAANAWYTEAVYWANEQELMNGVGNGKFNPGGSVTRAQLVTILWRLEGSPSADPAPFTDANGSWYKTAVAWAYHNHIVTGKTATTFAPSAPLSRAQAAAIFHRYSNNYHEYNTLKSADLSAFPDYSTVPNYAVQALSWANAEGLITGSRSGDTVMLNPAGMTNRAQLATILQRFITYTHTQGSLHSTIRVTQRFHYLVLDTRMQEFYRRMDAAVENLDVEFYLGKDLTQDEIKLLYNCYSEDNPEHFYLGLNYGIKWRTQADGSRDTYMTLTYSDGVKTSGTTLTAELRNSILAKKAVFDECVHNIIHTIHVGLPMADKEKAIHDWIISNNSYDYNFLLETEGTDLSALTALPDQLNAYGAIVNGGGVCEAYAAAFQVLCHAMGIHCTSVEGIADGQPHRWNAVQLDGEWYVVDTTFDDPLYRNPDGSIFDGPTTDAPYADVHYKYFNKTCASLPGHQPKFPVYHPTSTGTKYSYENYFKK